MNATYQAPERWISVREFRLRYGVSHPTVSRWIKQGRIKAVRVSPGSKGRLYVVDPEWLRIDVGSSDPSEWLCALRQCDVARLLGISARMLRYMESAGKTRHRLVGRRKLYSLGEVRRLIAQREIGCERPSRSQRSEGVLRWARRRLGLSEESTML